MKAQLLGVSTGLQFSPPLSKDTLHSCSFPHKLTAGASRPRLLHVAATLQDNVAKSSSGTNSVKVKLVLVKRCEFGQQFHVVGDDELLGAWDPVASIPMQWSEGHIWTTDMEMFAGKRVEFKVILMGGQTVVDWQPGPNRVLETSEASMSPIILETQWKVDDCFAENDMQSSEIVNSEKLAEPAKAEQISFDLRSGLKHEVEVLDDKVEHSNVAKEQLETSTMVSKPGTTASTAEAVGKDVEKKLSVLEKDLQWGRDTLSMIFGAFKNKDNKY